MKNAPLILGLVVILALGALLFAERQSVNALQQQIAASQALAEARAAEAARAQADMDALQKKIADLNAQFEARNKEIADSKADGKEPAGDAVAAGVAAGGEAKGEKGGFAKMMQKMFTDPDMKKMVRSTQSMGVKMMYGDLAKELKLAPDQATQVLELLADRQMAMTNQGLKMLGGDKESGAAAEADASEVAASKAEYDAQLENILGKEGFAQLGDYERTVGDRMQIQQYRQSFSASGVPLDENQSQGLLGIMKEERVKQPPSPLEPGTQDVGAAVKALQSEEALDSLMGNQEDLNRRVLTRARDVLTPDQMVQFETIQKQQLEMQKMGMKMGREFMKGVGKETGK